ncbi:hypothetical protein GCM10010371_56120 [Streptomyces subrutilus]|uniref:Uncharacterized protein n=1 Tax=Streptomyces subrutilus TaxID=36818 RepID=A0A918VCD8_9ACTN|nr:hypothetical protein GCM10010371_56120 [Streptomyces subrutilus]
MLWTDPIDTSDRAEPIEPKDNEEPMDPMDSALPTEPMDSTDPTEPMERNESFDHKESEERPTGREGKFTMAVIVPRAAPRSGPSGANSPAVSRR